MFLEYDGDIMGYWERGCQGLHQRGYGALFLKGGFGRGRERGHCSLADREEGTSTGTSPLGRWIFFSQWIETVDLTNRKSVGGFAEHHGWPRGTGGGSTKAKASADGWREWTGVR